MGGKRMREDGLICDVQKLVMHVSNCVEPIRVGLTMLWVEKKVETSGGI